MKRFALISRVILFGVMLFVVLLQQGCSQSVTGGTGNGVSAGNERSRAPIDDSGIAVATGAIVGAGIGAIAGVAAGNPGAGAIAGSAVGAAAGGYIASDMEETNAAELQFARAELDKNEDYISAQEQEIRRLRKGVSDAPQAMHSIKSQIPDIRGRKAGEQANSFEIPAKNRPKSYRRNGAVPFSRSSYRAGAQVSGTSESIETLSQAGSSAISQNASNLRYQSSVSSRIAERERVRSELRMKLAENNSTSAPSSQAENGQYVTSPYAGSQYTGSKYAGAPPSDGRQLPAPRQKSDPLRELEQELAPPEEIPVKTADDADKVAIGGKPKSFPGVSGEANLTPPIKATVSNSLARSGLPPARVAPLEEEGESDQTKLDDQTNEAMQEASVDSVRKEIGKDTRVPQARVISKPATKVGTDASAGDKYASKSTKSVNRSTEAGCPAAQTEAARARNASSDADKLFYYRRALRLCPKEPSFHIEMGRIFSALGRTDEARSSFEKALEIDPDSRAAADELSLLKLDNVAY